MSATGRSNTGETGEEFYPTPETAILPILETPLLVLPGGMWIEPCAGSGSIVRTVARKRSDVRWILCELDPRVGRPLEQLARPGLDVLRPFGDFVHMEWTAPVADVLVMNPPFSLASQFLAAAFERAAWVLMLQRTNWFGSQSRAPWLRSFCPDQYALPDRPSFRPDGKTDSCEYSWFVWPPGDRRRRSGRLAMLDSPETGQAELPF